MLFSPEDLQTMRCLGIDPTVATAQLELIRRGVPPLRLIRPATVGDGIRRLSPEQERSYRRIFEEAAPDLDIAKMTPASGAASRMFRALHHYIELGADLPLEQIHRRAVDQAEWRELERVIAGLEQHTLACTEELSTWLERRGQSLPELLQNGEYRRVFSALILPEGLGCSGMPKALLSFHRDAGRARTALEEQMAEACAYTTGRGGKAHLHVTIPEEYTARFHALVEALLPLYRTPRCLLEVTVSHQSRATDTIAADEHGLPFRDENGRPVFRPGGHGALLENLERLSADVVFLKNIDNVVPPRLLPIVAHAKKVLGGVLVAVRQQIFRWLELLQSEQPTPALLHAARAFVETELGLPLPAGISHRPPSEQREMLHRFLHRPVRVCGMVPNQGEPGGGPFWVDGGPFSPSLQIVEGAQVDSGDPGQRAIAAAATHFNPVDVVCSLHDHTGRPFRLAEFSDPDTAFISRKTHGGRRLQALELPGLWNGAMAGWLTLFVEVPLITFNPVKTIADLLRPEHSEA